MQEAVYSRCLEEHLAVFARLEALRRDVTQAAGWVEATIRRGGKVLVCGNGGSAADAQHFAAELVGRFQRERRAWPAIALTTDTSILTAIGNDYGFNTIFSRQTEALASAGDLLVGISTSGNSENVLRAVECARSKAVRSLGLLGGEGGAIGAAVDLALTVPSKVTAHVQEAHIFILHAICLMVESSMENSVAAI
ncbi:MAG: D-sedoheptulose-7-phosphate isomerase [Syntrophobacteraceae bacterium]